MLKKKHEETTIQKQKCWRNHKENVEEIKIKKKNIEETFENFWGTGQNNSVYWLQIFEINSKLFQINKGIMVTLPKPGKTKGFTKNLSPVK